MIDTSTHWRPTETPKIVSWLITISCLMTLGAALFTPLFHLLQILAPQELFSLSWFGLNSYFFWQPISYIFTQEISQGIDFVFLLTLLFNMYVLWVLGSTLHTDIGPYHLLTLYLAAGAVAGLSALSMEKITGDYATLYGPSAALLALFTIWVLYYGDSMLFIFFLIPFKTKSLFLILLGGLVLIHLFQFNFVKIAFYLSAPLFAYLYGTLLLGLKSPYPLLAKSDEFLHTLYKRLFKAVEDKPAAKIFNLKGEAVLSDDEFIDAMLTKISRYGEKALSSEERARMDAISRRKRKD